MLYEKIQLLCKERNISIRYLETEAGIGLGTVSRWKAGKCGPSQKTLLKIADFFQISVVELLDESSVNVNLNQTEDIKQTMALHPFIKLPVVDPVSLSICAYIEIPADNKDDDYFAFKIKDDSMNPIIIKNDIVIARSIGDVKSGDTAIVIYNNESYIRKVTIKDNIIAFLPFNPLYESFIFNIDDPSFSIKGVVIEIRRTV